MKLSNFLKKFHALSIRTQVLTAVLAAPILSSLVLLAVYYGNMKNFYEEKVEIYRKTSMDTAVNKIEDLIGQVDTVSDQVLGMAVLQSSFEGYTNKTAIEKLQISREITSQLSNIRISNKVIDNIYLLDFDGNGFTTNSEWNRRAFTESLPEQPSQDQKGKRLLLPPRPAVYRYMNRTASAPDVISFITYLNQYTRSGAIGLVQIDLSYDLLSAAFSHVPSTNQDFYFIVGEEGTVIWSPEKELAGKPAKDSTFGGFNLGALSENNIPAGEGVYLSVHKLQNSGWKLIQVNSDSMLKEELNKAMKVWLLILLLCLFSAFVLSFRISVSVTRPITDLIKTMGKAGRGNLKIQAGRPDNQELAELTDSFNTMIVEIDQLMKENVQKEHEKTTMQMMALNAKINSHFLYNTLNSIKWQAIKCGQKEIAASIVSLAKILEYSYKDTVGMVSLKEEFVFLEDYIHIQNLRYGSRVELESEAEQETLSGMIYKMLLQPIVENAMIHAFSPEQEHNRIAISCSRQERDLLIRIHDNGKGFTPVGMDKLTGIGLNNVLDRMNLNYNQNCSMKIKSGEGKGTTVELKIPFLRETGETDEDADC